MTQTFALFIDALSTQYISSEHTPNLFEWAKSNGFCKPAPIFAFQGVGTAMFAGVSPNVSGIWTDLKVLRNPRGKPDIFARVLDRLPEGLPRKALLTAYERLYNGAYVTPHIAPADLRPYYEPALTTSLTKPNAMPGRATMFDVLRGAGRTIHIEGLDGGPQKRLMRRLPGITRRREDFVLFKITFLDHMGHAFGPDSQEILSAVGEIDRALGHAAALAGADSRILVFADHGMTSVKGHIDPRRALQEKLPHLVEGRDYVPFYNSTCVMFRWQRDGVRDMVHEVLREVGHIRRMEKDDYAQFAVDRIVSEYADDVYITQPGIVVSPDFYSSSVWRGMHGFATTGGETATIVSPTTQLRDTGFMWDIAPTLLDMSGLPIPQDFEGRSLCMDSESVRA